MSHIDEGVLTAYADGAYGRDSADAKQIAEHLAICENCRNRLEEAQALSGRAAEILSYAAPAAVAMPEMPARKRGTAIPIAWAATVILAVGLGWLLRGEAPAPAGEKTVATAPQPTAPAEPKQDSVPLVALAARAGEKRVQNAQQKANAARIAPQAERTTAGAAAPAENAASVAQSAAPPSAARVAAAAPPPSAPPAPLLAHWIHELPIVSVDGPSVQQRLPDGVIITVTSRKDGGEARQLLRADAAMESASKSLLQASLLRDGEWIQVTGPLTIDSLRSLLHLVR